MSLLLGGIQYRRQINYAGIAYTNTCATSLVKRDAYKEGVAKGVYGDSTPCFLSIA